MILVERIRSDVKPLLVRILFRVDDSWMISESWLGSQPLDSRVRSFQGVIHASELHVVRAAGEGMQMLKYEY